VIGENFRMITILFKESGDTVTCSKKRILIGSDPKNDIVMSTVDAEPYHVQIKIVDSIIITSKSKNSITVDGLITKKHTLISFPFELSIGKETLFITDQTVLPTVASSPKRTVSTIDDGNPAQNALDVTLHDKISLDSLVANDSPSSTDYRGDQKIGGKGKKIIAVITLLILATFVVNSFLGKDVNTESSKIKSSKIESANKNNRVSDLSSEATDLDSKNKARLKPANVHYHLGLTAEREGHDEPTIINHYDAAAQQGHIESQYRLALRLQSGERKDLNKARSLLEKASSKGYKKAYYTLAQMYANGLGGKELKKEAFEYSLMACTIEGNGTLEYVSIDAMAYVGQCYHKGVGVTKDLNKALDYYIMAAKHDEPSSLYNLGVMHMNGEGVVLNAVKSLEFFEMAKENGSKAAAQELQRLSKLRVKESSKPIKYRPLFKELLDSSIMLGWNGKEKTVKIELLWEIRFGYYLSYIPLANIDLYKASIEEMKVGPYNGTFRLSLPCVDIVDINRWASTHFALDKVKGIGDLPKQPDSIEKGKAINLFCKSEDKAKRLLTGLFKLSEKTQPAEVKSASIKDVASFIKNFYESGNSDLNTRVTPTDFYADKVEFFGELKTLETIKQDQSVYEKKWTKRKFEINNEDIAVTEMVQGKFFSVKSKFSIYLENTESTLSGRRAGQLTVSLDDGKLKIIVVGSELVGKDLRKEKH